MGRWGSPPSAVELLAMVLPTPALAAVLSCLALLPMQSARAQTQTRRQCAELADALEANADTLRRLMRTSEQMNYAAMEHVLSGAHLRALREAARTNDALVAAMRDHIRSQEEFARLQRQCAR